MPGSTPTVPCQKLPGDAGREQVRQDCSCSAQRSWVVPQLPEPANPRDAKYSLITSSDPHHYQPHSHFDPASPRSFLILNFGRDKNVVVLHRRNPEDMRVPRRDRLQSDLAGTSPMPGGLRDVLPSETMSDLFAGLKMLTGDLELVREKAPARTIQSP